MKLDRNWVIAAVLGLLFAALALGIIMMIVIAVKTSAPDGVPIVHYYGEIERAAWRSVSTL